MTQTQLYQFFLKRLAFIPANLSLDILPFECVDNDKSKVKVTALISGQGLRPTESVYCYTRPVYLPRELPIELVYEDEDLLFVSLIPELAKRYGVPEERLSPLPTFGKISDYLTKDSPLGHFTAVIDDYHVYFEQPITLAPRKLDVKYLFRTVGGENVNHEINHFPLWVELKKKLEGITHE